MDRYRHLKRLVLILAAIMAFELGFTAFLVRPGSIFIWISLGIVAVVGLYLVVISLALARELHNKETE